MKPRTADLFVSDTIARGVLTRLGETIPDSLSPSSIGNRYMIGAEVDSNLDGYTCIKFVDGSSAKFTSRGWSAQA